MARKAAGTSKRRLDNRYRDLRRGRRGRRRRQVQRLVVRVGLGLIITAASVAVLWGARRGLSEVENWMRESRTFTVREIVVEGNYQTARDEIARQLEVDGTTLLHRVDLEALRARVVSLPFVRAAEVSRQWPDRLLVRISERVPVAVVNLGRLHYVDADGEIFKPVEVGEEVDFPVITGLERDRFRGDRAARRAALARCLELLAAWNRDPTREQEGLAEIHVYGDQELSVFTRRHVWQLYLGEHDLEETLARWQTVLRYLGGEAERILRFDCRYENRIVVRYRETGS
jgi:cell division protein FtsQ